MKSRGFVRERTTATDRITQPAQDGGRDDLSHTKPVAELITDRGEASSTFGGTGGLG